MPLKRGRSPTKPIVIRDLHRGLVTLEYLDEMTGKIETMKATLIEAGIPDQHMAESDPNSPLEPDLVHVWDIERFRWNQFRISQLESYEPQFGAGEESRAYEEGNRSRPNPEGTGHRISQGVQASEETQTHDRGTEGQGPREPRQG